MTTRGARAERGAVLIVLMVGVAVAAIALTAAMQVWSTTWRRENEEEIIFRGGQYAQAILAYQKEHGGQYPLVLEDLYKQGPRRFRYIRKLFKDPIAKNGKWGLVYLAPGGQTIYDPGAAMRAQQQSAKDGWDDPSSAANGAAGGTIPGGALPGGALPGGGPPGGALPPGYSAIGTDPNRAGVPNNAGPMPGALPPGVQPPQPGSWQGGGDDKDRISEPPLGWPIIGVVSRVSGKRNDQTYRVFKGHDKVNEWQFLAWDLCGGPPQVPGNPARGVPSNQFGPGIGGHSAFGGVGPGGNQLFPQGGRQRNQGGQQQGQGNP